MSLYERLIELNNSDMLPLHMPGHKRTNSSGAMSGYFGIDITEIDGFDDLHNPDGILLDMEKQAARIYGCDRAYISVNGSTGANEAAIMTACPHGTEIIMPRASHKSVYHAVELGHLRPVYIEHNTVKDTDITDAVSPDQVKEALESHPDCGCVLVTSPTYEGISADISRIAQIVHEHNAILIVDSAHGAHFGLAEALPDNPIKQGADLVIVSLHKTLPSPTQTALLLVNETNISDTYKLQHYMSIFQTSSPSYILMAGIGECLNYMEKSGKENMDALLAQILKFKDDMSGLVNIDVNPVVDNDPTKLIIRSKSNRLTGYRLYHELRDTYHIQCEMYSTDYCLAMLSVMDGDETFIRLVQALGQIDETYKDSIAVSGVEPENMEARANVRSHISQVESAMTPGEALALANSFIPIDGLMPGMVSAGYVMEYPPGIPILVPGEVVNNQIITYIKHRLEMHLNIVGLHDGKMLVVD